MPCRRRSLLLLLPALLACRPSGPEPLAVRQPLHLEEHLEAARITGSEVPKDLPADVEWRFDAPQPEWKLAPTLVPGLAPATVVQENGALQVRLGEENRSRRGLGGGVYVDLPGWNRQDWAWLVVRARATGPAGRLTAWFNLRKEHGERMDEYTPFLSRGEVATLVNDGSVQSYLLRADWANWWEGDPAWRQLGLMVDASGPAAVEILSVSLIPKEANYAKAPAGVITEPRDQLYRRALFTHAPGTLSWRVRIPEGGRLDVGLGVLRDDAPVTFRVTADGSSVFEETWAERERWGQRSVDLSRFAGRTVTLALETRPGGKAASRAGTVALWAAPTVSGETRDQRSRAGRPPSVILYVIDAGGAEYTSAYGYNRRTTPNLERLAASGALFENAYSNSTWSKPSTTSFMTGLHHTVLGGYRNASDPVPDGAPTMAELLHRAGWQTAVFTSNAWCGTMSGLERGVDTLLESIEGPNSASSAELVGDFWRWRDAWPGLPYWVHFQSTDVHWPWEAVPPVAGTYLSHERRLAFYEMERKIGEVSGSLGRSWALRAPPQVFEKAGIDRRDYFDAVRDAYDEAMAFADLQLGYLVAQLKARGEWENTVLIVTADHGDWPGLGLFDSDPRARVPYLNPYLTRVPLVVVWPAKIAAGQRFRDPVSLIDLLPTVLDLTEQSRPDHLQGQSLAPLLLGRSGWEPRPVLLDETNVDPKTGEVSGAFEIVDGRWGASLAIAQGGGETAGEGPRLLLYDLWNDPYCLRSLHRERPDLVKHYTGLLERKFREHRALAKKFKPKAGGALDPRQLETLKSLGYIG